jgi:hypothetical protein
MQVPTFFADVRIPVTRSITSRPRSFADLSNDELHQLASQQAFSGRTAVDGSMVTWQHEIDFEPPRNGEDVGRVERLGDDRMLEHGTDGSYTESWRSDGGRSGPHLAIRVARGQRLERTLLVAGDRFLFVRNRARDLQPADSFGALIASAASRAEIEQFLDCEFSFGVVRGGTVTWEIQHSTLPWRESRHLDFVDRISIEAGNRLVSRNVDERASWTVPVNTFSDAALASMFRR